MNTPTVIGAWATALAGIVALVSPDTGTQPSPVAASGEPFFSRTVEVTGESVADLRWDLPDPPDEVRHYDVIIDIEGDPGFVAGSDGVTRVHLASAEAILPTGRTRASASAVVGLGPEYGIPQAVVGTSRGSLYPPEPGAQLELEWDTAALTFFGSGTVTPDRGYEWTITVEVVPVFDV